jgi:predicted dehydrogenase
MVVRVGIIGTGFGGSVQAPGFQCLDDAQLVAVASGRLERAQQLAQEHGLQHAYDDYREMLRRAELDLVSITAPPHLHREMVLAALEAGAHVLCEKPFAMNVAEAHQMLEAAKQSGRVHAVDHEFRYVPARAALMRMIDEGAIGDVFFIRIADLSGSRAPTASWWYDRAQGGGLLQAIGSHYIDAVRIWGDSRFERVAADIRAVVPERESTDRGRVRVTADDTSLIAFHLENGVTGRIDLSAAARAGGRRMEVYGSQGTLVLEGLKLYHASEGDLQEVALQARDQGRLEDARLGPFVELAQRVVDRINGKDSGPFPTFADGVEVQRVMDAAHRSADEGREVRVAEVDAAPSR